MPSPRKGLIVRYPTPSEVTFWKKCVPCEGSTSNFSMPHSTITFASEMWFHLTGTPRNGSEEPQRPGPTRIYERPSSRMRLLNVSSSSAIFSVASESKASDLT